MKIYATLFTTFLLGTTSAQTTKKQVYREFELSKDDNRGIELVATNETCERSFSSAEEAIEYVFNMTEMTDFVRLCIDTQETTNYLNSPMDLESLVELYIELKK